MQPIIWVGIAGTIIGLAFLINGYRVLRRTTAGHMANAARIHIPVVLMFVPVMWAVIAMMLLR